jgi:hypothetical protein
LNIGAQTENLSRQSNWQEPISKSGRDYDFDPPLRSCCIRLPCCFYEVDKATQERFAQAFLSLKEGQNEEVLQVLRGKSFVRANNEEYAIVRLVAQQLKMM